MDTTSQILGFENETTGRSIFDLESFNTRQVASWHHTMPTSYRKMAHLLRELTPLFRKSENVNTDPNPCVENPDFDKDLSSGEVSCYMPISLDSCSSRLGQTTTFDGNDGRRVVLPENPKIVAHAQAASTLWDMGFGCDEIIGIYGTQERDDYHTTFETQSTSVNTSCVANLTNVRNFGLFGTNAIIATKVFYCYCGFICRRRASWIPRRSTLLAMPIL